MRGAEVPQVVSHSWAGLGNDGVVTLQVEREGSSHEVAVAIPASIPKWPVAVVSGAFGSFALLAILGFPAMRLARLAFFPSIVMALWLAANFGRTPTEMLGAFWLRAIAVGATLPVAVYFYRHFPEGDDSAVRWARGWPALFALQGIFFLDVEMFAWFHAPLADLVPKFLTLAVAVLLLVVGTINYRHATPTGRRRSKWLLLGFYVGTIPPAVVATLSGFRPELGQFYLPSQLAQLAVPAALGFSLWRSNDFDIDRLLNATVVYLGFAAAGVLALVLGVPAFEVWAAAGQGLAPETARTLATAVLLGLAVPSAIITRSRLDDWVLADRRALERDVASLQREIGAAEKLDELATRLVDRIPAVFKSTAVVVFADAGEELVPVARMPLHVDARPVLASGELARALSLADGPVSPSEWRRPEGGWSGREQDLLTVFGDLLIPLRVAMAGGSRLAGFVALGPREAGQPYEVIERSQLAAVLARAGAVLTALEHNERLAQARELSSALSSERDETDRVSREKTTLLAAASHDLRQPLHALGLFLGALEERVVGDEARALLSNARDSAQSMRQMFDALLDVSQLDAGVLEPRIVAGISLGTLFGELERELAPTAERSGLRLRVDPTGLRVRSDPALLRSILQNLLGNALRYTDEGSVALTARALGADRVRIEVRDTGPGIAPEARRRLFDEWQRGGSEVGGDGFGLGLTIVHRLSRVLAHELSLESELGQGSVFALDLEAASAQESTEAASGVPQRDGLAGREVWIVEDDRSVRLGLATVLEGWGLRVKAAATPEAAREWTVHGSPDAWLIDLRLGGGASGFDVAELAGDAPVCIISGEAPEVLAEAQAQGLLVLRKPVEPVRLRAVLTHLFEQAPTSVRRSPEPAGSSG